LILEFYKAVELRNRDSGKRLKDEILTASESEASG